MFKKTLIVLAIGALVFRRFGPQVAEYI